MNIAFYKPAKQTVEQAPVKKIIGKVPQAPRLVLTPNGTLAPVEDILDWDFDTSNRAGE